MAIGTSGQSTNSDRGGEPASWHHTAMVPSITFTWHHTIPWNCLRAVWDYLVANQHWACVKEYLMIISAPNVEATLSALKKAPGIPFANDGTLLVLLTWQGWNIVEGPGNEYRALNDDPGEAYDKWDISALTSNQRASVQCVDIVYQAMKKVQENSLARNVLPLVAAADVLKLQNAFKAQRPALRGRQPITWNPGMWDVHTEGRVDAKAAGVWYTKPSWTKKRQ